MRTTRTTTTERGGDAPVIYVVASYEQAIQQGMRRNQDIILDVVTGDVKKGGTVAKVINRRRK